MKVYTAKEVAEILKINYQTVLEMLRDGRLESFRTGSGKRSEWRVTEAELMNFMTQNGRKQTDEKSKS